MKTTALTILIYLFMSLFIRNKIDFIEYQQLEQVFILGTLLFINQRCRNVLTPCLLVFFMYYTWVFVSDRFIDYLPIWAYAAELTFFGLILLFQISKKTEFVSDEYDSDYVFLIFFKPKTFWQWCISLFGSPYASMGSIINGEVYRLKHSKSGITSTKIDRKYLQDNYLIINTGTRCDRLKNIDRKLREQSAFSKKRLYTRTNCVESQRPLLDNLSEKWHYKYIWDFIPSYYIYKRIGRAK